MGPGPELQGATSALALASRAASAPAAGCFPFRLPAAEPSPSSAAPPRAPWAATPVSLPSCLVQISELFFM